MLFDTHTHINDESYTPEEREALIKEIEVSVVSYAVDVGYSVESSRMAVEHAAAHSRICGAVGVHPHDTYHMTEEDYAEIKRLALRGRDPADPAYGKILAIGEIGLDYHYDKDWAEAQKYWFRRQIALARELDLPISVHSRDADRETMDILKEESAFDVPVVIHCYSGSAEFAKEYVKLGVYFGFDGPLTYKNNKKTVEAAKAVPGDRILAETDAPYLTPVPFRGERNKSLNVEYVVRKLAEIRGMTFEEAAELTTNNAKRFFRMEGSR